MGIRTHPIEKRLKYKVCDYTGYVIEGRPVRLCLFNQDGEFAGWFGHFLNEDMALSYIDQCQETLESRLGFSLCYESIVKQLQERAERPLALLPQNELSELNYVCRSARRSLHDALERKRYELAQIEPLKMIKLPVSGAAEQVQYHQCQLPALLSTLAGPAIPLHIKTKRRRAKYDLYLVVLQTNKDIKNKAASKIARCKVMGDVVICKVKKGSSLLLHYDVDQCESDARRAEWLKLNE